MKKKIAILGSTGFIGRALLDIVIKNRNEFEISLLTANKSHKSLLSQAKKFNVKNLIILDKKSYNILKKKTQNLNINIYNNFNCFNKIFRNKIDYVMSSVVGIGGLEPTIKIIKFTKKIVIANKESIICGWNLIKIELKKYNTEFIPVDSEHFSLWYGLINLNISNVEKIYLTASGGPFHKTPLNRFKKIKISQALKHPNWTMGKKISIDSATLINKIYEVIEAKNIFDISYNKIQILIHPKSYVHALLKFKNGLIKIIAHDTTMKIPIFNTIYFNSNKKILSNKVNFKILNNLDLKNANSKRYPMIKLMELLPNKSSLFETVIVSANDTLVEFFLEKKIKFTDIHKQLFKILNDDEFLIYRKIEPKKLNDILDLNKYVRLKLIKKVYNTIDNA